MHTTEQCVRHTLDRLSTVRGFEKVRFIILFGSAAEGRAKEISGRRDAIGWAIGEMGEGDVLVIAGKGHEQGQIIGDTVEPFDDVEEAKKAMGLKG